MEISLTWIVQEIGLNQQIDMHFPKLRSRKVQYLGGEVAKELKCRKNLVESCIPEIFSRTWWFRGY